MGTLGACDGFTEIGGICFRLVSNISASCCKAVCWVRPNSRNGEAGMGFCRTEIKSLAAYKALSSVVVCGILTLEGKN